LAISGIFGTFSGKFLRRAGILKIAQSPLILMAKLWVPAGGSVHERGGEMSLPAQPYRIGIGPPATKASLDNMKGKGIAVGGTRVGVAIGDG
jgi:hypothetical protein